jgi:SM-20-related protein
VAQRAETAAASAAPARGLDTATRALVEELLADGIAVRDGFAPPQRVRELTDCAHRRRARGDFGAARVGADRRLPVSEKVRGDLTCWLDDPLFAGEHALLGDLEQLRLCVNQQGFLGLFDLEMHYAWYPPGAGYERHVDQLHGRTQRIVSVILYLNDAWKQGAGGELRVFDGHRHRDIEPLAGRLVCFLSEAREHAVLPTRTDRLSITGWFRRRIFT